jgi:hypothetical protein
MARNIVLDLLATLYGISRITARQWKGCPQGQTFFIRPAARREARAWSDRISHGQKLQSLRGAFSPASRYPPQRGSCHGDHSRKVSRPAAAEEGVCESGYRHARWIAAGDAGLV